MPTIATIVGARPQFIKAAAVSAAIRRRPNLKEVLIHTGQHYDDGMSSIFFRELGIPAPYHHLGIGSGSHGAQTGRMLQMVESVLAELKPDWVLVYGDTNSTLAASLAAAKLHLPIAHVEAGLRSYNRTMPEELNRVLTDHAADLLLAPSRRAIDNLRQEGVRGDIRFVGDVMVDAAHMFAERAEEKAQTMDLTGLPQGAYVLATIHRAENTDDPRRLQAIYQALSTVARHVKVLWPLHPRTRRALQEAGLSTESAGGLHFLGPVGYLDMVLLEKRAGVIATDSGGVQKEAFLYQVPCVTLRTETEWEELLALGWNRLARPDDVGEMAESIHSAFGSRGQEATPYGSGNASEAIADALGGTPCAS